MTCTTVKWTVDEYHQIIEAGLLRDRPVELWQGEIVEMAPEGPEHAYLTDAVRDYLQGLLGDRAKVREDKPITLAPDSEPEPDIAIVQPLGAVYRQRHPFADDVFWLIEFANSSLSTDRTQKQSIYANAGIPEYWLVDLKARQVLVFREPAEGAYRQLDTLQTGSITPLAFSDLAISIERLL